MHREPLPALQELQRFQAGLRDWAAQPVGRWPRADLRLVPDALGPGELLRVRLFPSAHGRALAAAIPGARLIELDDVGHQLPPPQTWERLVDVLIEHTGQAEPARRQGSV